MAQRVLLVEESRTVAAALRRYLEGAGFRVDLAAPGEARQRLEPSHAMALMRAAVGSDAGLADALKAADPGLPVVLIFDGPEEADDSAEDLSVDGVLVGPLSRPAVVSLCRAMARLRAQAHLIARMQGASRRPAAAPSDLDFLKRIVLMEVKRSRRYRYPISLALVAVDGWKQVGAKLDGRARAALLGDLLGVVTRAVRDIDLALAYSAERFLVLMPHTRGEGALEVANRIVARVRAWRGLARVTASVGVATSEGNGGMSFGSLTRGAAEGLMRAQTAGGDKAVLAGGPRRKRDRIVIG
jgi:diguanylate cyclase (GGDEF)-like protein